MKEKLKVPFSKIDKDIYKILLLLYFVLNGSLVAVQILLMFTRTFEVEASWINFAYLKEKYGSLYWLIPSEGIIIILIISSINLLDYRYEFLPPKSGYKYSLRIPENAVKQIRIDRITYGISSICFFILLLLMVIKGLGAFVIPSFDIPNLVIYLMILAGAVITIIYHIESSKLSQLDRQQQKL